MFDKVLNTPLFNIGQLHFLKKYNEDLSVLETNMETISNCHYIETSQLIGRVFQLTNFYGIAFAGKTSYSIKRRRSLCNIFWNFAWKMTWKTNVSEFTFGDNLQRKSNRE